MFRPGRRSIYRVVLIVSASLAAAGALAPSASALGSSGQYIMVCGPVPYSSQCTVVPAGQPRVGVVQTVNGVIFLCPSVSGDVPVCQRTTHLGSYQVDQMMVVGISGVLWVGATNTNDQGVSHTYETEVDGPAGTKVLVGEYNCTYC